MNPLLVDFFTYKDYPVLGRVCLSMRTIRSKEETKFTYED